MCKRDPWIENGPSFVTKKSSSSSVLGLVVFYAGWQVDLWLRFIAQFSLMGLLQGCSVRILVGAFNSYVQTVGLENLTPFFVQSPTGEKSCLFHIM